MFHSTLHNNQCSFVMSRGNARVQPSKPIVFAIAAWSSVVATVQQQSVCSQPSDLSYEPGLLRSEPSMLHNLIRPQSCIGSSSPSLASPQRRRIHRLPRPGRSSPCSGDRPPPRSRRCLSPPAPPSYSSAPSHIVCLRSASLHAAASIACLLSTPCSHTILDLLHSSSTLPIHTSQFIRPLGYRELSQRLDECSASIGSGFRHQHHCQIPSRYSLTVYSHPCTGSLSRL